MNKIKLAWVVRPYPHGIYRVKEFLNEGIVAIGWPGIGDLTPLNSREQIKQAILRKYKYSSRSLGQAGGNIYRFKKEIHNGNYVLLPDGPILYVGKVISEYVFEMSRDNDEQGFPHQRKVDWFFNKRAMPRRLLTGRLFDSLKGRQTVFSTYHDDVHEIVTTRKHYFSVQSNAKLKTQYLKRLQAGLLRNVNSSTFEEAVRTLFSKYFPGLRRLATTGSKKGDTDLMAELPGTVTVRIQVKHFYVDQGELQASVVDQLASSMSPGESGIIVTSAKISQDATNKAEIYTDRALGFVDGEEFVELLFDTIPEMDEATLSVFGLTQNIDFL
jgi:predicted Mrr-cat superfamily restriction endonuclease